jgi:aspartyl-tRNA synthetase
MEILDDYHEVVDMLERLMLFIFNGLAERYAKETELVRSTYAVEPFKLPQADRVPRIDFSEGVRMLREAGEVLGDLDDLTTPQEKKLGQLVLEKVSSLLLIPASLSRRLMSAQFHSDFYTLDKFPANIRPFYTQPNLANPALSNSFDMFIRGQEIL